MAAWQHQSLFGISDGRNISSCRLDCFDISWSSLIRSWHCPLAAPAFQHDVFAVWPLWWVYKNCRTDVSKRQQYYWKHYEHTWFRAHPCNLLAEDFCVMIMEKTCKMNCKFGATAPKTAKVFQGSSFKSDLMVDDYEAYRTQWTQLNNTGHWIRKVCVYDMDGSTWIESWWFVCFFIPKKTTGLDDFEFGVWNLRNLSWQNKWTLKESATRICCSLILPIGHCDNIPQTLICLQKIRQKKNNMQNFYKHNDQ